MSDPINNWNPEDGPAPTEEELRAASRLADALDRGVPPEGDDALLHAAALRVRASLHVDDAAVRSVTERAVAQALRQHRSAWWTRGPRLRIAAAAAFVLAAAGAGGGAWMAARARPSASPAPELTAAFDAPVELGAGSAPSMRLYDRGLRSYRDALLGGSR